MAIKKQKKAGGTASKAKKPAVKTTSRKTAGGKKTKSSPVKKVPPPKAKAAAPKKTAKATVKSMTKSEAVKLTKTAPIKKAAKKAVAPSAPASKTGNRFSKKDLAHFRVELIAMRERITGQSGAMRTAALQRNDEVNLEEEGTDAFIRLQTLTQVGTQQQIVANIDEALRSIEQCTYGICDMCGALISKPRLKVLPFAKNCINCQSEIEQKRYRVGRR